MSRFQSISFALIGLFLTFSLADIKSTAKITSSGLAGMGAFESTVNASQDKTKRNESSRMKFTGSVLKFVSGKKGKPSRSITRLDKELVWSIQEEKKEYSELTFEEQKKMMEQAIGHFTNPEQNQKSKNQKPSAEAEVKLDIKKTDKKIKVSGIKAKQVIATMDVYYFDSLKNKQDTLQIIYDAFMTDHKQFVKEISDFTHAYAEKMDMDIGKFKGLETLWKIYGPQLKEIGKEIAGEDQQPIKYTLTVRSRKSKAPAGEGGDKSDDETPTSVGDLKKSVGKSIFGFFKKKSKKKKESHESKHWNELNKTSFEYTNIEFTQANPSDFKVPDGYKKVEVKLYPPEQPEEK